MTCCDRLSIQAHGCDMFKKEGLHSTGFEELKLHFSQSDIVILTLHFFQYIHNYTQHQMRPGICEC